MKKEKELNPIIEEIKNENKNTSLEISDDLAQALQETSIVENRGDDSSDTFFRNVVNQLFSKKDISTKTEYLSITENFTGSKLQFLSNFGNMPYLHQFIQIFEEKRVSLKRLGRKEILTALQYRQQEIETQKLKALNLNNQFGV